MPIARCTKWGEETRQECSQYRDDGYYECSSWESTCSKWLPWPLSYLCKVVEWFCVAWYWVANVVCAAWTYITEAVCLVWEVILTAVSAVGAMTMEVWDKFKKAWKKVKKAVKKIINVIKDIAWRAAGGVDFIASLLGIRLRKYLRLQVYILSKNGGPVQKPAYVETWLRKTIEIFDKKVNVEVRRPNLAVDFINVIQEDAPTYALNPPNHGFGNYFRDAADYFDDHCTYPRTGLGSFLADWLGYGEPIYAFVVDEIQNNKAGSVYWWGVNYCIIASDAGLTTMAHELGHVCGLTHWGSAHNLMKRDRDHSKDCDLNRLQISWIRDSRFVVFFPRRG